MKSFIRCYPLILVCVPEMLKLVSVIFYQILFFSPNDRPAKTIKNIFYFIEKALALAFGAHILHDFSIKMFLI